MVEFEDMLLSCSTWQEIVGALNKLNADAPIEKKKRLTDVYVSYVTRFGVKGAHERMNNRTVRQIFGEFQPMDVEPIASGELEGVRFELYEAPQCPPTDQKTADE